MEMQIEMAFNTQIQAFANGGEWSLILYTIDKIAFFELLLINVEKLAKKHSLTTVNYC